MDTFFVSHDSPTLPIDETNPVLSFFKSWLPAAVAGPERPRVILVVSGHWETATPAVNVIRAEVSCTRRPDLAKRTKELREQGGFGPVKEDRSRGLDHGAWLSLMLMYPDADIPVCQLSVQTERDGTYHYNLGKALAPLRNEGVLILGSGSATHNFGEIGDTHSSVAPWAAEFDTWLKDSLLSGRDDDVNHYEEKAPYGKMAHPQPDHFYPLHVALGAAGDESKAEQIHQSWSNSTLSYASYRFTPKN